MRGGKEALSFNTSNLISQLKENHAEFHATFVQQSDEKKQQRTPNKKTQLSLKQSAEKKQKYDQPRQKAIDLKIMECIALDNHFFFIVQDAGQFWCKKISVSEIKSWTISEYRIVAEKPISSIPNNYCCYNLS